MLSSRLVKYYTLSHIMRHSCLKKSKLEFKALIRKRERMKKWIKPVTGQNWISKFYHKQQSTKPNGKGLFTANICTEVGQGQVNIELIKHLSVTLNAKSKLKYSIYQLINTLTKTVTVFGIRITISLLQQHCHISGFVISLRKLQM